MFDRESSEDSNAARLRPRSLSAPRRFPMAFSRISIRSCRRAPSGDWIESDCVVFFCLGGHIMPITSLKIH